MHSRSKVPIKLVGKNHPTSSTYLESSPFFQHQPEPICICTSTRCVRLQLNLASSPRHQSPHPHPARRPSVMGTARTPRLLHRTSNGTLPVLPNLDSVHQLHLHLRNRQVVSPQLQDAHRITQNPHPHRCQRPPQCPPVTKKLTRPATSDIIDHRNIS